MIQLLRLFIRRNLRDTYGNGWFALTEVLSVAAALIIYWYTAQAFGASFKSVSGSADWDYFSYVVWGEALLTVPMMLMTGVERSLIAAVNDGTFELFLTVRRPTPLIFTFSALGMVPKEAFRALLSLVAAAVFFRLQFNARALIPVLLIEMISIPVFLGLGLMLASLILLFGRGSGVVHQLGMLLMILAGTYFPVSLFPESVVFISRHLSPFTYLLSNLRGILAGEAVDTVQLIGVFLLLGVASMGLGWFTFMMGLRRLRHQGRPIVSIR